MRFLSVLVLAAIGLVSFAPEPAQAQPLRRLLRGDFYYGPYYDWGYYPTYSSGYYLPNYYGASTSFYYAPGYSSSYYSPSYYSDCGPNVYTSGGAYAPRMSAYYAPRMSAYYAPTVDQQGAAIQQNAQPSLARIELRDNSFEPQSLNIQAGATVQFVNAGQTPHTVTSDDGRWESGDIPPGGVFNALFIYPGNYQFHCRYHLMDKMVGKITVAESGPPSAQPGAPPPVEPGAPLPKTGTSPSAKPGAPSSAQPSKLPPATTGKYY